MGGLSPERVAVSGTGLKHGLVLTALVADPPADSPARPPRFVSASRRSGELFISVCVEAFFAAARAYHLTFADSAMSDNVS